MSKIYSMDNPLVYKFAVIENSIGDRRTLPNIGEQVSIKVSDNGFSFTVKGILGALSVINSERTYVVFGEIEE